MDGNLRDDEKKEEKWVQVMNKRLYLLDIQST